MTSRQLIEDRAERGDPRGSANVWASAHGAQEAHPNSWSGSLIALRLSLVLSAICLLAVGLSLVGGGQSVIESSTASDEIEAPTTPGPAPILLHGYSLERVAEPFGDFVGSEIDVSDVESTRIFADPDDPYEQSVLGIDTLRGGGFQPWGVNMTPTEIDALAGTVKRTGDGWGLPESADFVEVARFADDATDALTTVWQFDFADGASQVILQAQQMEDGGLWQWVGRSARDEAVELSSIDVLGHSGVVMVKPPWIEGQPSYDEVVWMADGFTYRLTAAEVLDNTAYGRSAAEMTELLTEVDSVSWQQAVEQAGQPSVAENAAIGLGLLALLGWLLSSVWFLVRGPRSLAVVGLAVVLASLWFLPEPVAALLAALGLVAAWAAVRRRDHTPRSVADRVQMTDG